MKIIEEPIEDIQSLVNAVLLANNEFKGQVWWRGQENFDWNLSPSVFRSKRDDEYERNIIFRFMQRAPSRYPNTPTDNDYFGWLSLMQHHLLPTRLLDWTESPLYACYFAVEEKESNDDGALFALCPYKLNHHQVNEDPAFTSIEKIINHTIGNAFISMEGEDKFVVGIIPKENHIRLMVQLSVFTVHGSTSNFDNLSGRENFLLKFRIPYESKKYLREQLKFLGVRESNLFQDLDHLAKEVRALQFDQSQTEKIFLGDPITTNYNNPLVGLGSSTATFDSLDHPTFRVPSKND
jgi:hypothetical protein